MEAPRTSAADSLWPFVAVLCAVLAMLATGAAGHLYFWRRRLPDGQLSVVPEVLVSILERLSHAHLQQARSTIATLEESKRSQEEIRRAFSVFSAVSADKDTEIQRLKAGGDRQVYAQALRRFIRVLRLAESDIAEDAAAGKDTKAVDSIQRHLKGALLDLGLEPFEPEIGGDYRTANNVTDNPRIVVTEDPALDWKISRTISAGYLLRAGGAHIVAEKAVVEIFRAEIV